MGAVREWLGLAGAPKLLNAYGTCETAITNAVYELTASDLGADGDCVPVGYPVDPTTTEITIRDSDGRQLVDGSPGEVWISGSCLSDGYVGDESRTRSRFVEDESGRRFFRTRDIGKRPPGAPLVLTGRVDRQIKRGGRLLELGQLERRVERVSGVREAAIIEADGTSVAFIVVDEAADRDLCEGVRWALTPIAVTIHIVERLPSGAGGKRDYRSLERCATSLLRDIEKSRSRMSTTDFVCEACVEAFGLRRIDPERPFFEQGGDSLGLIRLVELLAVRWPSLTPEEILMAPSAAKLAEYLRRDIA